VPLAVKPCILNCGGIDGATTKKFYTIHNKALVDLATIGSGYIQNMLKKQYKKLISIDIGRTHNTVSDPLLEKLTFRNIWRIGFPNLIGIRLKVLYRDLFPNLRRHRAGLCDSSECAICGEPEDVDHQLFECPNSKRLWDWYGEICGVDVPDNLYDAINYYESDAIETVKSIVFKTLIGIDRGKDISINRFKGIIRYYSNIETHSSCASRIQRLLDGVEERVVNNS